MKSHCSLCGQETNHDVIAMHEVSWEDERSLVEGSNTYFILKCCGCEKVHFREDKYFSENTEIYDDPKTGVPYVGPAIEHFYWPPRSKKERPEWLSDLILLDQILHTLLEQVYSALDLDLDILATIGVRTAFDRATEIFGIDTSLRFDQKLDALVADGRAGETEREMLGVLVDAGNAAAHRGWRPDPKELSFLVQFLEQFIDRNLISNQNLEKIKVKIPQKPKKKKKNARNITGS